MPAACQSPIIQRQHHFCGELWPRSDPSVSVSEALRHLPATGAAMEGRQIEVFTVNAFTSAPFCGNPASVCLLEGADTPDSLLQGVAAQMNHSETAFVSRLAEGDDFSAAHTFRLRWFTPTTEVKLCGHGTMAAAAVLFKVSR